MSVLIETTLGDLVIDLAYENYKIESYNFLKLCEMGFYDRQCFYDLQKGRSVMFGDALVGFEDRTELRTHNMSIKGLEDQESSNGSQLIRATDLLSTSQRTRKGQFGFKAVNKDDSTPQLIGSQVVLVLNDLEEPMQNMIFYGEVTVESQKLLKIMNSLEVDDMKRPLNDIRIKKTYLVFDPFPPLENVHRLSISLPLRDVRISKEWLEEHRDLWDTRDEILDDIKRKELVFEIASDVPTMGIKPSECVLFICKLNPLTRAKDIATIFHRFGEINSVELIRDKLSGRSLGYGFIEFKDRRSCEESYKQMDGVLIDDKRIHVNFSQSFKRI